MGTGLTTTPQCEKATKHPQKSPHSSPIPLSPQPLTTHIDAPQTHRTTQAKAPTTSAKASHVEAEGGRRPKNPPRLPKTAQCSWPSSSPSVLSAPPPAPPPPKPPPHRAPRGRYPANGETATTTAGESCRAGRATHSRKNMASLFHPAKREWEQTPLPCRGRFSTIHCAEWNPTPDEQREHSAPSTSCARPAKTPRLPHDNRAVGHWPKNRAPLPPKAADPIPNKPDGGAFSFHVGSANLLVGDIHTPNQKVGVIYSNGKTILNSLPKRVATSLFLAKPSTKPPPPAPQIFNAKSSLSRFLRQKRSMVAGTIRSRCPT